MYMNRLLCCRKPGWLSGIRKAVGYYQDTQKITVSICFKIVSKAFQFMLSLLTGLYTGDYLFG
jgi:hypothetical protein